MSVLKQPETFRGLRKRLRGCAPGIDINLDRDICATIGTYFRMLTTSIDAVDAATQQCAPGWGLYSLSLITSATPWTYEYVLFRDKGEGVTVGGSGSTECKARLDALLAALEIQKGE